MIGHFLLSLTPEQEDKLLTLPFQPIMMPHDGGPEAHCLIMRLTNGQCTSEIYWRNEDGVIRHRKLMQAGVRYPKQGCRFFDVGHEYEYLCGRFGTERVNTAIRNRILTNKLNRGERSEMLIEANYKPGHSSDFPF